MTATHNGIRLWHIGLGLTLTALLDIYAFAVTIPELTALAGQPIFETRVGGYAMGEAVALLAALGAEGRTYYLARHVPADTALAIVEAVTIMLIILRVTRPGARFTVPMPNAWRMALLAVPALTLIFDLGENALVADMLVSGARDATQAAVASTLTQAKWAGYALSIALALVLPLAAWRLGGRRKRAQPQHASPR